MVVGENGLFGGKFVDGKTGVVGCELMFSSTQVVYVADMGLAFEVLTRTVDLGPGLFCVGSGIDMNKAGSRHVDCLTWSCFGHPEQGLSGYMYSGSRTQLTNADGVMVGGGRGEGREPIRRAKGRRR